MATGAVACGAIWMVLNLDLTPVAKPAGGEPAARKLAYEEALAAPTKPVVPPVDSKPSDQPIPQSAAAMPSAGTDVPSAAAAQDPSAVAAVPPPEDADTTEPAGALPWQHSAPDPMASEDGAALPPDMAALPEEDAAPYDGTPPLPGEPTDGAEAWGNDGDGIQGPNGYGAQGPDGYAAPGPDGYGAPGPDGYAAPGPDGYGAQGPDGYGAQDPDGYAVQGPEGYGQPGEEWVQVIISGAAMRATAAEDAPMLFAFPYGRNLRVVSRYEGWVEVTDPQSAATGWMPAHHLAPTAAGRPSYGQTDAYYDEPQEERRGWFRRRPGGLADMINKALGGR